MTTGKTIALTRWTFVGKWCLCFLVCCLGLSWFFFQEAIIFLISWLLSPSVVIFGVQENKFHCFHFFSIYLPWSDGKSIIIILCIVLLLFCLSHYESTVYMLSCIGRVWLCGPVEDSSVHGILQAGMLDLACQTCHTVHQGTFLTQGLNPCFLHLLPWQAGSLPVVPPINPLALLLLYKTNFLFCDPLYDF